MVAELDCSGAPDHARHPREATSSRTRSSSRRTWACRAANHPGHGSAFVSVQNIANIQVYEFFNANPIQGRVTVGGCASGTSPMHQLSSSSIQVLCLTVFSLIGLACSAEGARQRDELPINATLFAQPAFPLYMPISISPDGHAVGYTICAPDSTAMEPWNGGYLRSGATGAVRGCSVWIANTTGEASVRVGGGVSSEASGPRCCRRKEAGVLLRPERYRAPLDLDRGCRIRNPSLGCDRAPRITASRFPNGRLIAVV